MISHTSCKSHGVDFESWYGIFELLLTESKVPRPKNRDYVQRLFEEDFTALEAVHHMRILTITSGLVTVSWNDAYGRESVVLSNNESLRYFYKQNPNFKKSMDFRDEDKRIFANIPKKR